MSAQGLYFLDGFDLWTTFGIAVQKGSADFLKMPPKKQSTEHDWPDANGIDVDLSAMYFSQREGTLTLLMVAESEQEWWDRYELFKSLLSQPGLRRLSITAHGQRSYYVFYKETSSWSQVKPLQNSSGKVMQQFSITIVEPEPQPSNLNLFLTTEDGKLLIA